MCRPHDMKFGRKKHLANLVLHDTSLTIYYLPTSFLSKLLKFCTSKFCIVCYKHYCLHHLQKGKHCEVLSTFTLEKLEREGVKSLERWFKKVFCFIVHCDLLTYNYFLCITDEKSTRM